MAESKKEPQDVKARIAASYDQIAQVYFDTFKNAEDTLRIEFLNRMFALLASSSDGETKQPLEATSNDPPTATTLLELGCGNGIPATLHALQHASPPLHVTANDISPTQLSLAATNLAAYTDRLTLVPGDMTALSFPPHSFTLITAFYTLIHVPRAEQPGLLAKFAEWVRPGGYLLANFAVEESEAQVQNEWMGERGAWMFWSGLGEEGSVRAVEGVGFEVLVRERRRASRDAEFVWVLGRRRVE
ncbi:methyltransferase domain-containing protein [Pyrenochaeta sp. DS3sAY3a]|nr:methyltransferase domain-containing protein [Pyrenochaeta sp. DS3sAY3a]